MKAWGCVGIAATIIASIIVGMVWGGWVFSQLWSWFIVPVFGLPALSVAQAMGISLVVSSLASHNQKEEKDLTASMIRLGVNAVFSPLMFLVIGWLLQSFI